MSSQIAQIAAIGGTTGFIAGTSPSIQVVNTLVQDIAATDIPVLLVGECGTGKEIYARLIHRLSATSLTDFCKADCATLRADNLRQQVLEYFPREHKNTDSPCGTVFLDEIDELDLVCQRSLLTILPDGQPANGAAKLSARLIAATSKNLEQEIEAGRFRRDLYFRINGVCLRLPPLRERKEDIPGLLTFFLAKHAALLHRPMPMLAPETVELLIAHAWPGNIRELENVAKKIVALGEPKAAIGDLRGISIDVSPMSSVNAVSSLKVAARAATRRTEKELILKALERTRWNRKRAAQDLQISYKSLLYKLKQIGVPETDSPGKS